MKNKISPLPVISLYSLLIFLLIMSGCTTINSDEEGDATAIAVDQPYYPAECKEILIPGGLKLEKNGSMFINTDSFKGGFLKFSGRLEINSLTDFFINSMPKNGWQRNGMVKYKNVLLAFSKKDKTCMITIRETSLSLNTEVAIYLAEIVEGAAPYVPSAAMPSASASEENIVQ
jgi:hypothetical protein